MHFSIYAAPMRAGLPVVHCEFLNKQRTKGKPMKLEELRAEMDGMLAIQTALITLVSALIRTHHDETNLQMSIVETMEIALNGAIGKTLTEKQKDQVRDAVETLRSFQQQKPGVQIGGRRF